MSDDLAAEWDRLKDELPSDHADAAEAMYVFGDKMADRIATLSARVAELVPGDAAKEGGGMQYKLTYSRVGNAKAFYCLTDLSGNLVMSSDVYGVWNELTMSQSRVRELCHRARNSEAVLFRTGGE